MAKRPIIYVNKYRNFVKSKARAYFLVGATG